MCNTFNSNTIVILKCERSQNTVLLASTQAVYKTPHSTPINSTNLNLLRVHRALKFHYVI